MTKECWLQCPELFESLDPEYGLLGPFGDTGIDSDTPMDELDPELVAAHDVYMNKRVKILDNLNANFQSCPGAQVVYDVQTRKPFLNCPITPEPYRMSLE